jgi:hypothetical protein
VAVAEGTFVVKGVFVVERMYVEVELGTGDDV